MRLFLSLILLLSLVSLGTAASIEGRVVDGDSPVVGIRVLAYRSLDWRSEPLASAEPTAEDGRFRLEVPAGYVALYAQDEQGRFAFCGRNPVHVVEGVTTWAGLQLLPTAKMELLPYDDEYTAGIEGVVRYRGRPLAGAQVSLYLDVAEDLKGQGYRMSLPTGADGYFAFHGLPESDYFLVARKRNSGARLGPVRAGDLLSVYPGNPLSLQAGKLARVELTLVQKQKAEQGSESPNRLTPFRLQGTVVDAAGQPLSGLHVFAYREQVIGHQRPAGLSSVTGADGRFEVSLPEAGTYYVGARQLYGDSPTPGELFGMYEGSPDHGLQIVAGQTATIRIEVRPVSLE